MNYNISSIKYNRYFVNESFIKYVYLKKKTANLINVDITTNLVKKT